MKERVQKLMAQANIGSRRACEQLIEQGRVQVNGKIIQLGDKADPEVDVIVVDGQKLKLKPTPKRYIAIYKPKHYLSTKSPHADDKRRTIYDLAPLDGHFFPVGRLDADSEGLMVLTNDGEAANRLTHPRYQHTKTYKVVVEGHPTTDTLDKWQMGIWLDDARTNRCYIRVLQSDKNTTTLRIIMTEGKKRQIRRIAAQLGHPVQSLLRTHIGQLGLGTMKKGDWFELEQEHIEALFRPAEELKFIRQRRARQRPSRINKTNDHS